VANERSLLNFMTMHFQNHDVQVIIDTHGNPWWPASIPCELLGILGVAQAVGRLDDDEKKLISIDTLGGRQKTWCINEYGLYRLILTSRKPEAKAFTRWLTHEVIPEIRKRGGYRLPPDRFVPNTQRPTQVQNAKDVGHVQSAFGGRSDAIRWFETSLKEITGQSPKEWIAQGKTQHLRGEARRRGREVVRLLHPAGACAASLADELVVRGIEESEAIAIGHQSTALFQRMLNAGVTPAELHSSPLDGLAEDVL
jgi:prophage antirepressor-like protein